jgi:hypothetical protein
MPPATDPTEDLPAECRCKVPSVALRRSEQRRLIGRDPTIAPALNFSNLAPLKIPEHP